MFTEITAFWLEEDNSRDVPEIYIHLNEKGKIIRTYCWKDTVPYKTTYLDRQPWEKITEPKKSPSQNSLFVNISKQFIIKNLHNIYIPEEDFNEFPILFQFSKYYNYVQSI